MTLIKTKLCLQTWLQSLLCLQLAWHAKQLQIEACQQLGTVRRCTVWAAATAGLPACSPAGVRPGAADPVSASGAAAAATAAHAAGLPASPGHARHASGWLRSSAAWGLCCPAAAGPTGVRSLWGPARADCCATSAQPAAIPAATAATGATGREQATVLPNRDGHVSTMRAQHTPGCCLVLSSAKRPYMGVSVSAHVSSITANLNREQSWSSAAKPRTKSSGSHLWCTTRCLWHSLLHATTAVPQYGLQASFDMSIYSLDMIY